ncbi:MAG: serine/threonine protein kinase [Lentisphaeria bacterium]|nr:serine/threonine protein kinase [Lentisphaeria bacterium]
MEDKTMDEAGNPAVDPQASELEVSVPAAESAEPDRNVRQVKIYCHQCQQKLDVTGLQPFAHLSCPVCGVDLIIPKWFDTYLLEEPCGRGGMASVYRALDIALDREVAVKILDQNGSNSPDSFLNEARTAATINHSCVIPIYTCGVFENQAYFVMQFMNGGSLEQKLLLRKGAPLPVDDVLQWFHDAAEGLEYAARHGIIHHDVKPGNIMLDADGNAKIGDFGIAGRLQSEHPDSKADLYGSPLYVSPEKVSSGFEELPGDIYSLGATFYHLLTGVPPFQHENLEELLWARVKQNPIAPHQLRSGVSPLVSSLIMRMMNHSPELRPGYDEIIRTLSAVLNDTDTSSLVMRKEMPLPKVAGGTKRSSSATSSVRVKSPSVVLKRRRSSISRELPATAQDNEVPVGGLENNSTTAVPPVAVPDLDMEPEQEKKTGWLLVLLIVLAIAAGGFLIYSAVQLIRSMRFSPDTVLSVQSGERK